MCSLAIWTVIVVLLGAPFDKLDDLMSVSLLASIYTLPYTFTSNKKQVGIGFNKTLVSDKSKTRSMFESLYIQICDHLYNIMTILSEVQSSSITTYSVAVWMVWSVPHVFGLESTMA